MRDGYNSLVADARGFFGELEANNRREWFASQKERYDADLKRPSELLLEVMTPSLERLTGGRIETKLFRPYRDVRFSRDKTPFHLHLHTAWTTEGNGPDFFFGVAQSYVSAGVGWMTFSKAQLSDWRDGIGAPHGAQLQQRLRLAHARLDAPELKRVPAPFDADHPRADLLRRKSFTLWRDEVFALDDDLAEALTQAFEELWPTIQLARHVLG